MKSICILLQSHYETDIRARRKAEALVAAGYSVDVFALRSSYSKGADYTIDGVNLYTVELGKKRGSLLRYLYEYLYFFFWAAFKLVRMMGKRRYAIIDTNNLPDFLVFAAAWGRWRGAKVVLDMHEITPEFYISKYKMKPDSLMIRLLEIVEQWSLRYADAVININHPIEDVLVERGMTREKSTIIMNSVDEEFFGTAAKSNAAPPVKSDATFVMMYHGTVTHIYGLDIAVDAFGKVHDKMPGAELWIVGTGTEKDRLAEQVKQLGLEGKVRLIGRVLPQEIPAYLKRCDMGVLATRQDIFLDLSFSSKLSEYIIMGKSVIASRLKTINRYFSDKSLAFFEPNNGDDLAGQMLKMYQNPSLRAEFSEQARKEFAPIRWEVMRDRYLKLVADLCGQATVAQDKPESEAAAQRA
jgi:glycosyltransferase involved in cell wall biosynthesis